VVQTIIGFSCLSFELGPTSVAKTDTSRYFVVAWAVHPDLIPNEVGCIIPKPKEQLAGVPPLFIQEEEVIHSKRDTLMFRTFVHVLEVHDFLLPESSDSEQSRHSSFSDEDDDGYPGHDAVPGLLRPCPLVNRITCYQSCGDSAPLSFVAWWRGSMAGVGDGRPDVRVKPWS
jgi:hypothetical protein